MKQYYRVANKEKKILQKVYDCLNSWGMKDPFVTIPANHPAIMAIYKVTPTIRRMKKSDDGRRSSGCQGSSSEDYVFGQQK